MKTLSQFIYIFFVKDYGSLKMSIGRVELKDLERACYDAFIADLEDGSLKMDYGYCDVMKQVIPIHDTIYKKRVRELFLKDINNDPQEFCEFLFGLITTFKDGKNIMLSITNYMYNQLMPFEKLELFWLDCASYCSKKKIQKNIDNLDKRAYHLILETMQDYYDYYNDNDDDDDDE